MADYIRTPSRMFPDMSDLEASAFLSSEKARSLGFHHHHPAAGAMPGHPFSPYPRLPALPLATIQQHLLSTMQRSAASSNGPSGSGFPHPAIPFPHHLLSQWTSLAAGFGLNQLGLFGLTAPSAIPDQPAKSNSPNHRFSPYPGANNTKTSNPGGGPDEDSSSSNPPTNPSPSSPTSV